MEIITSGAFLLVITFIVVIIAILCDNDEIASAILKVLGISALLLILVGMFTLFIESSTNN